jgi:hypothetical protein
VVLPSYGRRRRSGCKVLFRDKSIKNSRRAKLRRIKEPGNSIEAGF